MTNIVLGKDTNGADVGLDIARLIETQMLVQATTGGGKTTTLRRILERSHGLVQQLVIDPEGEFYTLRERYDYIVAGKGGDCAAEPRSAKLLARRLLELGVSAVCDLSELKMHDRIRFVRFFCEALIEAPRNLRHPTLIAIDEAHIFCPEKGQAESAPAVIDLSARGRKRGLAPLLATQRLAKLHKDVAAQLGNVLIGRTGLDIDQQRAADVLGFAKAERLALRDLAWREFHAFGPAFSFSGVRQITIGDTETQNPKMGQEMRAPVAPSQKVRALLAKVTDLPAEAEQEARDNETLRRDLADARRKLTLAEKARAETSPIISPPCDHEPEIARLEATIGEKERELEVLATAREQARQLIESGVVETLREVATILGRSSTEGTKAVPASRPPAREQTKNRPAAPERGPARAEKGAESYSAAAGITAPQQRILDTLAVLESIGVERPHKSIVAVFAEVSPTSGGYFNNLGRLRSLGLIDYPEPSTAALSEAGRGRAAPGENIATLDDLHDAWCRRVTAPQGAILRAVIAIYPGDIAKDELAEQLSVSPTSGGYFNNLGRLRTLGAVDYPTPGRVAATALLFPEGLR